MKGPFCTDPSTEWLKDVDEPPAPPVADERPPAELAPDEGIAPDAFPPVLFAPPGLASGDEFPPELVSAPVAPAADEPPVPGVSVVPPFVVTLSVVPPEFDDPLELIELFPAPPVTADRTPPAATSFALVGPLPPQPFSNVTTAARNTIEQSRRCLRGMYPPRGSRLKMV